MNYFFPKKTLHGFSSPMSISKEVFVGPPQSTKPPLAYFFFFPLLVETPTRPPNKPPAVAGSHAPPGRGPARPEGQFKPARERRRPALGHLVIRHYTVA